MERDELYWLHTNLYYIYELRIIIAHSFIATARIDNLKKDINFYKSIH